MPGADRLGMGLSMSLLILSGDTTGSRVRRSIISKQLDY